MPRTPWRRRTTDSPRPAGRLAGGLRRGGSIARQVLLVGVVHRGAAVADGAMAAHQPAAVDGGYPEVRRRYRIRNRYRTVYLEPVAEVTAASHEPVAVPAGVPPVPRQRPAAETPVPVPALLPGPCTSARRLRFTVANSCTVSSLMLGMVAIFLTMHGQLRAAAICLIGGVVFDGLDGALARRLGVSSPFGAQLDSLADMSTFGVATPVVVYASLHGSAPAAAIAVACAVVAAGSAIRLARFNVSPRDGRFFAGVPTTMAAAVLSVGTLIGIRLPGALAVAAVTLVGLAMVSSFPYAKLSRILKLPPWLWLLPVLGAFLDVRITFACVVLAYLVSGPLLWLRRR